MSPSARTILIQVLLFVVTLITTTLSGAEWIYGKTFLFFDGIPEDMIMGWPEFWQGLNFSLPFLLILTVHEFGHYFVAKIHQVEVTLPYYIPLWFGFTQSIGTMGAFIRIKSVIRSRVKFFDIGIAGPLAGFVAALGVLWYGFTHLPPPEYIFTIHPEYARYGLDYGKFVYQDQEGMLVLGDNILFWWFKEHVADPARIPHPYEMIHYPYLLAGFISLFFTALNLIPIGQLDGGHIMYGLLGKKRFNIVAPTLFILFAFYAGLGLFKAEEFATLSSDDQYYTLLGYLTLYVYFLYICLKRITDSPSTGLILSLGIVVAQFAVSYLRPDWEGYSGFLFFVFLLGRFLGVYHPETADDGPLGTKRILLGWLAVVVFILCASPKPFILVGM